MFALKNKNFEFGQLFLEIFKNEINIKHIDNNGFNIFDYAFQDGYSLTEECIQFIYTMFNIYKNDIDGQFLNLYTRYGRNSLLNLCEDYALHIYEKFYFINKKNAINYIRCEIKEEKNKLIIPLAYKNQLSKKSQEDFKQFISKTFYPLIEEFIKRGCDINCHTKEKMFKNKSKEFEKYKYYNNYGKIYPIMYLLSYPESDELINLIKKYKININCTDLKNQTLLMYLLEVQKQIKNISKNNYQKIFDYLLNNCNNISAKNNENKNLFITEFEKGNQEESLNIFNKLGHKLIDINEPCYDKYLTIIGKAIVNSNEKQIEFLLNNFKNIDLNKIDIKFNRNALHYTCMQNSANQEIDFSKFAKWINLGVSITQKDNFGRNPLFYLFLNNENLIKKEDPISTLSYLLDSYNENKKTYNALNLDDVDILGNPLIFYAVEADAVFCVSSLLSKGVKIKNVKNLEKNSVFSYALIGNSNSLPELFSKVNNVKVFEDKIYNKNKKPIEDAIKKAEEKLIMGNNMTVEENENKEINYSVEELFYPSNENKNIKDIKNVNKEEDDNLEKLYEENDEGTSFKILGNNNDNDEFNNYWMKSSNSILGNYTNSVDVDENDSYDFPKLKTNNSNNFESDYEDNNSFIINTDKELSTVNMNTYTFNYCNNINILITNYINKNYGNLNYHYQNNYIPKEGNEINIQKYPKINSIKYKISISEINEKEIFEEEDYNEENEEKEGMEEREDKNEEEKKKEENNKILSESLFKYCIEKNSQNIIYYILNQGFNEFQAISDSLLSAKFKFSIFLLERFNSISTKKLQIKNGKGQILIHILCNNKNSMENKDLIKKIYNILTTKINLNIN